MAIKPIQMIGDPQKTVWIKWGDGTRSYLYGPGQWEIYKSRFGWKDSDLEMVTKAELEALPLVQPMCAIV